MQDMNCLSFYVSILEKVVWSNVDSSSMCVAERITNCDNIRTLINTTNKGALVVYEDTQALDVFEMDTVELIISDPHHKHVEEDGVCLRIFFLKSVMKDYSIREKFQTRSKRSSKKTYVHSISLYCCLILVRICIFKILNYVGCGYTLFCK